MVATRSMLDKLGCIREDSRIYKEYGAHVNFSDLFSVEVTKKNIEDLLFAGKYDFIDPNLLADWNHYRIDFPLSVEAMNLTLRVAQFDTTIKCGQVVSEIFRDSLVNNYFPGHYSLLEFGWQFPDEQRLRPIVSFDPMGRVVCLFGNEDFRGIGLASYGHEWSRNCGFLVGVPLLVSAQ